MWNITRGCMTENNQMGCTSEANILKCDYHCVGDLCNNLTIESMPPEVADQANALTTSTSLLMFFTIAIFSTYM